MEPAHSDERSTCRPLLPWTGFRPRMTGALAQGGMGRRRGGECRIFGATPEEVVAHLMDIDGRHFQAKLDREFYPCYETREVVSRHHVMFNNRHRVGTRNSLEF